MVNPILQAMQKTPVQTQINNPTLQLINNIKHSANPQQIIMNMVQSNPQIASIINQATSTGQTYKDLFYNMAKARGVDPDQILGVLR